MKPIYWLLSAALLISPVGALADNGKPFRVIVPYGAGGLLDTVTRAVVSKMAVDMDATFVVENKPGANANVGAAHAARASADGRVLLASGNYITTNPQVEASLAWSPQQLTPIARFALSPNVLVVPKASPYRTLQELLAAARKDRSISIAESGPGAPPRSAGGRGDRAHGRRRDRARAERTDRGHLTGSVGGVLPRSARARRRVDRDRDSFARRAPRTRRIALPTGRRWLRRAEPRRPIADRG